VKLFVLRLWHRSPFSKQNTPVMERKTNWLAVVVCVVAGMLMGFLWYGFLFTDSWMAGNGITADEAGEKMFKNGVEIPMSATPMIVNTVGMVVYALVLNWLLGKMNVSTWQTGASIGAAIGVMMFVGILIGNLFAANPLSLTWVDGSYTFLLFTLIGAVMGGWQKK